MNAVRLRPVRDTDLPVFYVYQRDPEANVLSGMTPRDHEAFMEHWHRMLRDPNILVRAVLSGEALAGNVLSFDYDGRREVGYWLGREFWGRGIASSALREFLSLEPIRPLYGAVATHNAASFRVLQKCGFRLCGEPAAELASGESIQRLLLELPAPARTP